MQDAFRLFIGTEDGVWHLLTTNNDATSSENDPLSGLTTRLVYDVGENGAPDAWRQARVSLAPFAGMENLRFRIDFTTAGEYGIGDVNKAGHEVRGVPGWQIQDGDTFEIGNRTFEFDSDLTITAPTNAHLVGGQWFTLRDENNVEVRFEFHDINDGPYAGVHRPIAFDPASSSSAEMAQAIQNAIAGAPFANLSVNVYRDGNLLNVRNRLIDPDYQLVYTVDPTLPADFFTGGDGVRAGNVPVPVHRGMTDVQVAQAVQAVLANTFNQPGPRGGRNGRQTSQPHSADSGPSRAGFGTAGLDAAASRRSGERDAGSAG
jgi:hypothetical protein